MEKNPNKFEATFVLDAEMIAHYKGEDLRDLVSGILQQELARTLVDNLPIEVTPLKETGRSGICGEVHKLTAFIFSEQQLNVYIEQQVKLALFTRAADNALNKLTDRRVN